MDKIYGIYSGSISNVKEIDKLNEVELFLAISSLENYILTCRKTSRNKKDIKEDEYALQYLINKTQNFGVELKKDETGKIIKTGDYMNWYQYHINYFNRTLSIEEFRKFLDLKSQGYNVSGYLANDSYLKYKKKLINMQPNSEKIKKLVI